MVCAARELGENRPGYGEHLLVLAERQVGGDDGARATRRFYHYDRVADAGDEAVALRKHPRRRTFLRCELRDEAAAGLHDAASEREGRARGNHSLGETGTGQRDRWQPRVDCRLVRRRVDAERETRG